MAAGAHMYMHAHRYIHMYVCGSLCMCSHTYIGMYVHVCVHKAVCYVDNEHGIRPNPTRPALMHMIIFPAQHITSPQCPNGRPDTGTGGVWAAPSAAPAYANTAAERTPATELHLQAVGIQHPLLRGRQ